ncbi:hypothetical protein [Xenorhabdus bovienii]|uniref:hypothetical protein n=1 Tax=Xenorhabdus bovienii TaxID=40576 RepID=UPI0023B3241A|nr:hypothetical protein [Xenorhabdus bovienii]MDE9454335.1 hypothetical protein [Xenorhabdus bovienii]MDE9544379.1 hypothetical protein [Xenorhabdus bovienii]MDE9550742.1 hypothetical protein [Xenorhabdus bovienii]
MKNIKVFRGFYTFEDTYRYRERLSICGHGEYISGLFNIGYLIGYDPYGNEREMRPNELYKTLINKMGSRGLDKFHYIHLMICHSASSEKDCSDSDSACDESFASEFSQFCPKSIIIGYVGIVYPCITKFNQSTLSYTFSKNRHRNEYIFDVDHIYNIHYTELSRNINIRSKFELEKNIFSSVETCDPITPLPFLRSPKLGVPIPAGELVSDICEPTAIWFKNGKRIAAQMIVL